MRLADEYIAIYLLNYLVLFEIEKFYSNYSP